LSLLVHSIFKHQAIFFLTFLDYWAIQATNFLWLASFIQNVFNY
jgi:hypothetical protein